MVDGDIGEIGHRMSTGLGDKVIDAKSVRDEIRKRPEGADWHRGHKRIGFAASFKHAPGTVVIG